MKPMPQRPNHIPEPPAGFAYVGQGYKDIDDTKIPQARYWSAGVGWVQVASWSSPYHPGDQYALPIDSDAYREWFNQRLPWDYMPPEVTHLTMEPDGTWFAHYKPPQQLPGRRGFGLATCFGGEHHVQYLWSKPPRWPGRWQDSVFERPTTTEKTMKKEYEIHHDGSVTYRGQHTLSADEAKKFVEHVEQIRNSIFPRIKGERVEVRIHNFQIGCQIIPYSVADQFCKEYQEGKWRKPAGYKVGQRFRNTSGYGSDEEAMIIRTGRDLYALLVTEGKNKGLVWDFNGHAVADPNNIQLEELAAGQNWEAI